ncbi:MAG TPA: ComEC/Rec2 family competence protein [Bryobacterales bacterium]|nr:ComEC/Rec2 family competence protein [Bryobacterales bacterium]
MKYPLVAPLAAYAAGVVAAQCATFSFRELSLGVLLLLALSLLGLWRGAPHAGTAACLAGFALAGALAASQPAPLEPDRIDFVVARERLDLRDPVRLSGWVRVPPTVRADRDQFALAVEAIGQSTPAGGGVRVTVVRRPGEPPADLHYGDHVEFLARLRLPHNFQDPGGFDRVTFLRRQGIEMTATVRAGVPFRRLAGRRGSRVLALIWTTREWAEGRIDRLLGAGSTAAGVVKAMLLGDAAYIDRSLGVSFQRTGAYHALVVAGLHVGALAWFFLFLFRLLRVPRGLASLAVMVVLIGFVLLCGSRLPTVRAAAMVAAYLLARVFYRQRRALNIMAGVALAMLAADPAGLFDVSFQLSFLSVGTIAALAVPILERTLEPYRLALADLPDRSRDMHLEPKVAHIRVAWRTAAGRLPFVPRISMAVLCWAVRPLVAIAELVVVSASVQIGLALPMAIQFHRLAWSGLSANVFVVPLIGLIVPLGFATVLTGWPLLGHALALLVAAMVWIVEWHARWRWLEARVPIPPAWFAVAFAAALAAVAWLLDRQRPPRVIVEGRNRPRPRAGFWPRLAVGAAFLALLAAVAGLAVSPFAPHLDRGKLEVTALDVGQGDALFLALPQGQTMLVDTGGLATFGGTNTQMPDIGEEVVSPYLWSREIRTLDVVVVSHAHYDHIGGLPALLENFRVRELWIGSNPPSPDYDRALDTARRRGVRLVRLCRGEERRLGGVRFTVLAPPPDYVPRAKPANDDSIVLRASFGDRSFLLTGDIEQRSERRLADDGLLGHADVLKVAHHGSKTSSSETFLDGVRPWFAVVSAGFDNPYGHPNGDVLSRLADHRATVFRTDRDGAVSIETDGHRLSVGAYEWNRR